MRLVEVVIISISPPKRTFDHRCWLYLTKKVTKPTSYCTVAICYVAADNPIPKNYYHLPLSYIYSSVYIYTLRKGQTQRKKKKEKREKTAKTRRIKIGAMVLNCPMMMRVANVSAKACQYIACNPEILPSDQVLYLLFCFPFQQVRRLALCFWTFFCCPLPDPSLFNSLSSSSSSDIVIGDLHPHVHWLLCLILLAYVMTMEQSV